MTALKVADRGHGSAPGSGTFAISPERDLPSCREPEGAPADALQPCTSDALERVEASDAVKELFLAIVGHDLRGPLSTVLASARVLSEQPELPASARPGIQRILRSGE